MRKFKMKRWIAVMLVALLVAVNLSGIAALADGDSDNGGNGTDGSLYAFGSEQANALMNPEVPDELRADDPNDNPYGYDLNEAFAIEYPISSDGLFLYSSENEVAIYEDYKNASPEKLTNESNWSYIGNENIHEAYAAKAQASGKENLYESFYVIQTIAFDAQNEKRENYIAFLGVGRISGKTKVGVWVYNAYEGVVSDIYEVFKQ